MLNGQYYDIDIILAEAEEIPSTFLIDAEDVGYLDESADDKDIKQETKLDLPLWLAKPLASKNVLRLDPPRCFTSRYKTIIYADPIAADLPFYFYELLIPLVEFWPDIAEWANRVYISRYGEMLKRSPFFPTSDFSAFTERLTCLEKSLFAAKSASALEWKKWLSRELFHLSEAVVLKNVKKRKSQSL
eukprot:TRINITY_DN7410_c0_g1_i1.p1 TRINITY_DN7410_c0_g1~~TRINITY_DN7410_c0_g1_i1.p1  ORF type:complete len:188 (+),score=32.82 TRINITY_DN7410_c0_g1_i1:109-672(+)